MKNPFPIFSILFILAPFIFGSTAIANTVQQRKTDSLRLEIEERNGAEKITSQLELALLIFENSNQEAKELAKSALSSAKEIGDIDLQLRAFLVHGRVFMGSEELDLSQAYYDSALFLSDLIAEVEYKGEILFRQGVNQYKKGDQVKALETYAEALAACRETENFKIMGSVYSMMGTIFRINGMYDRAIEYNIKSALNYNKANYEEGNAWVNYLLGRIYTDINLPQRALDYFYESLRIYEQFASMDGNKNGVSICQEQIALQELRLGNHDKARSSIDIVLRIHTEGDSKYGISSAFTIFGKIEYSAGNYTLAEDYLRKSLDLKREIDDVMGYSANYEYLGLCQVATGQVEEGIITIKQGLQQAETNLQKKIQLDICKKLAEIYMSINELEKASFYQNEVIEIQNDLLFRAASVKMEQLQAFYEIDEQNSQILELEKENEISSLRIQQQRTFQVVMVIGILLALVLAIVIYLFNRKIQRSNQQLKELNITKDKLFSIISHDLQGPMGTTRGLSEVLLEKLDDKSDPDFKEILQSMHNNINETFDLLTNLLQWARTQIEGIRFNPEILTLHAIANKVLKSLSYQAQKKGIKLKVDIEEGVELKADANMLDAIVRNLISNAIKFTNEGGNIVISAIQKHDGTTICIKDDGIGMTSDTMKNLFSLDTNTSTHGTLGEKGTGLGLIVCKEFVGLHKGEIWVESNPNGGSTFCFTIPVSK